MAELATSGIGDRDRSMPTDTTRRTEGALYSTQFSSITVPSRAKDIDTIRIHGTVKMNRGGPLISVPVRVVVNSSYLSSPIVQEVGQMKHNNTSDFVLQVPTTAPPGEDMDLAVEVQHQPPLQSFRTGETSEHLVSVMTEQQYETADMIGYVPWMLGGAGTGYLVNSVRGGQDAQTYVLGGAAAGTAGRALMNQPGFELPSAPSFPTTELAVVAAVLFAGTMALNSARSASPISLPKISVPGFGGGDRETIRIPSRSS